MKRLNLNISDGTYKQLQEIKQSTNAASLTEVIRTSLNLYQAIQKVDPSNLIIYLSKIQPNTRKDEG